MNLDDLARRAASDARSEAMSRAPHLDPVEYRESRRRRTNRSGALAAGAVTMTVLAVLLVVSPKDDEPVVASTIPGDTASTEVSVPTTRVPTYVDRYQPRMSPVGGWEEIDFGPLTGGRERMAVTWADEVLFVFGGQVANPSSPIGAQTYLQDAHLYDPPTDRWITLEVPDSLCPLSSPKAIWLEGAGLDGSGRVLLYGDVNFFGVCSGAALFSPTSGEWSEIGAIVGGLASDTNLVWVPGDSLAPHGALLVPERGLAYDLLELGSGEKGTGGYLEVATLEPMASTDMPQRVFWTGTEALAFGDRELQAWSPEDEDWRVVPGPPVPTIARAAAMTDDGLFVVNYQMAAAWYVAAAWERKGDLPLRFYECLPETAVSAGGTPVVRMCSGIAIWDEIRGTWIPVPLEDVGGYPLGTLVGADDAVYSVGTSFRRFHIERNEYGLITLPSTIPIGVMQLDVPVGFHFVESFAPLQDPAEFISDSDESSIGVVFESVAGSTCRMSSTYMYPEAHFAELDGFTETGPMAVFRAGRSLLEGTEFVSGSERDGALALAFQDDNDSDLVVISCLGQPRNTLRNSATALAGGLWSPWEAPAVLSAPTLVVTPQAGGSGTVVTLQASGLGAGWIDLFLVSADGSLIEIPTEQMGDHGLDRFTWGFSVDRYVPPFDPIEIPAGNYEFAVDGRLIDGATFTKIDPPFPWVEIVEVMGAEGPGTPIVLLEIENRDVVSVQLDGWRVVDEIPPLAELVIEDVILEPGERLVVRLIFEPCVPLVDMIGEPPTVYLCAEAGTVAYESIALRDAEGHLVDRIMVAPRDDPWVRFYDAEYGVRFELPVDHDLPAGIGKWQIADESLIPQGNPWEMLSVGTYPMRPGGDRCAAFPQFALNDLGPIDALISVQRRADNPDRVTTTRPDAFTYEWLDQEAGSGIAECLNRADAQDLYLRFASFVDDGNLYYVLVAVGDAALNTVRAEQVLEILNRLEFDER